MTIKTQIKKLEQYEVKHRSGIERACTLALAAVTVFSLTGLVHDDQHQRVNREALGSTIPVFSPAEKNETVRMPIKFDDGLRATVTTSS